MEVFYSNINRLNEEIEEFVIAKAKIEKPLLDDEIIEKKMSIKEFIEYINLSNSTYILNDNNKMNTIAFNIFKLENNDFAVMYSSTLENEKIESFKKKLKEINYDISNLIHFSQLDIINGNIDLNEDNYFIINNEFYK